MDMPASIHKKLDEAVEGVRTIPKLLNVMMDLLKEVRELKAKQVELEEIVHEKVIMDKEKKLLPVEDQEQEITTSPGSVPGTWIPAPNPWPEQHGTVMYGVAIPNTDGPSWEYTTTGGTTFDNISSSLTEIKKHLYMVLGDVD